MTARDDDARGRVRLGNLFIFLVMYDDVQSSQLTGGQDLLGEPVLLDELEAVRLHGLLPFRSVEDHCGALLCDLFYVVYLAVQLLGAGDTG